MKAHIWLGLLAVPLLILHSGFYFRNLEATFLLLLFVIVILSGIWAAFDVLTALANGNLSINFGVLSFFIGLGLLRLSPVWRTWALIFTWFELICLPLAALLLLSGSGTGSP